MESDPVTQVRLALAITYVRPYASGLCVIFHTVLELGNSLVAQVVNRVFWTSRRRKLSSQRALLAPTY